MSPCGDVCTRHMANTCACVRTCVRVCTHVGASGREWARVYLLGEAFI